jgi:hypothetical protein
MQTVKYKYQTTWRFQLRFDLVHIQNTEIIKLSSLVHIWWHTKWNVASIQMVFLYINKHEDLLVCRVQKIAFCMCSCMSQKGGHRNCKTSLNCFHCYQASCGTTLERIVAVGHYTYSKRFEIGLSIIPKLLQIFITDCIQDNLSSSCERHCVAVWLNILIGLRNCLIYWNDV